MQTWIDKYIADLGVMLSDDQPNTIFTYEMSLDSGAGFEGYIGRPFRKIPKFVLGRAMLHLGVKLHRSGRAVSDDPTYEPFTKLDQLVLGFSHPADFVTKAIKLNEDIAQIFVGAKAPSVPFSELNLEQSICYLDVPPHTIKIEDDYLRAIFLITETEFSRVACVLDNHDGVNDIMFTFELGNRHEKFNIKSSVDIVTANIMQEKIENFIILCLLYHKIALDENKFVVPRITAQAVAKLSAKKATAKHHKNSLFNVHYLCAPKGHFGMRQNQREYTMSGSWDVRGHFRWQACGERKTKRKLIWIEGYVKGSGEKNPRLDVLS